MVASPAEAVQDERVSKAHGRMGKDLEGLRILLAEDGIDNQNLVKHLLHKAGAEVEVADNGRIALQKAAAEHFDLILMDMQMPEMDGYEATSLLRERGFTRPILALTAHAMDNDRQKCLDAGCDDYIAKPVNHIQLIKTIAQYCPKESSHQGNSAQVIKSEFTDDPDLVEIINQFVTGLAEKLQSMQQALANGDFGTLQRLAHQLKGAGGSYGYPTLTDSAKVLEDTAKARDPETAGLAFALLADLCRGIIAGRSAKTVS